MEFIQRTHPFGVSLGEVVVHCNYMYSSACQCVKKDRQSCDEGFALTGGHLGDLAFMECHAADKLDVVVNHVPYDLIAACHPPVLPVSLFPFHGY